MALAAAGDRVLVTLVSNLFSQRIMSTFTYGISSITGTPSQASLYTALHTKLTTAGELVPLYLECCGQELELFQVWYQTIYPLRYVKVVKTTGLGLGNYATGDYTSANQAAVILRRGDFGNRSNISSLHVPLPAGAGAQAGGMLGPDIETPLQDLAEWMALSVTTSGTVATFEPIINNGPNPGDYTAITTTQVQSTIRTMRRRGVGLGI